MHADSVAEKALATTEARLRALLEAAVDAIVSINERGIIEIFNAAAERMFGYTAKEAVGKNVSMLMPTPHREEHDDYIARYLFSGQKKIIGIGREVVGLRKNGTTFPMELSVAEALVGDERIFVGILRDITDRKIAEHALQASKEKLETAVAELQAKNDEIRQMSQQLWLAAKLASVGELAASIAHELNNPLATVCLRVESVLMRTPPDDPRRRALEIIDQEARRMGNLVTNLLQFCRRGAGQSSTVDVSEELTKAVELIEHHLRKRLINVVQEFEPNMPTLFADRQKLRQVFLNLLTNASDAMPEGGTLTLRLLNGKMDNGQDALIIEFVDTGIGIPPEHLDKAMEPFFTTKEEGKGTGLGLAICRRIIQEHHGSIQLSSELGRGTTVRVALPIRHGTNVRQLREKM